MEVLRIPCLASFFETLIAAAVGAQVRERPGTNGKNTV